MSLLLTDFERPRWQQLDAPWNDPRRNFATLRGKWTERTPKRKPRLASVPDFKPMALLRKPPVIQSPFKLPAAPVKVTFDWLAKQCGISPAHVHNILSTRIKSKLYGWKIVAIIDAFGRPAMRRRGNKVSLGLCRCCNRPRINANHCVEHAARAARNELARYYRNRDRINAARMTQPELFVLQPVS